MRARIENLAWMSIPARFHPVERQGASDEVAGSSDILAERIPKFYPLFLANQSVQLPFSLNCSSFVVQNLPPDTVEAL